MNKNNSDETKWVESLDASTEAEADVPGFNMEEAKHQTTERRLVIAKETIWLMSGLLLVAMGLLLFMEIEGKREILSSLVSSLFTVVTMTIGYVAGSSIDRR